MDVQRASFTALAACFFRAIHSRCDPDPLIHDTLGDHLLSENEETLLLQRLLLTLGPEEQEAVRKEADPGRALERAVHESPSYGGVIARARYVEDLLAVGLDTSRTQYVVLGAGLDTLVFRRPDLAGRLQVIEVDHPATQQLKLERLARAGFETPDNVRFVATDLEAEPLEAALDRGGFDRRSSALFAWLGVTPYLTREANFEILSSVGRLAAPTSELAFDYLDKAAFDAPDDSSAAGRMKREREGTAEPFVSSFAPDDLHKDLMALGLEVVEDLSPSDVEARYCAGRADGLRLRAPGRIALARVTARAGADG